MTTDSLDIIHNLLAATYPEDEAPDDAVQMAREVFDRLAALEGENEALRKELQRVSEISERETADYIALQREHKAATELLTRIARALAKARVPVPKGPLDVQVAHLAGRAA